MAGEPDDSEDSPCTPKDLFDMLKHHVNQLPCVQQYQAYLDASTPYTSYRWIGTGTILLLFFLRIVIAQGWYIGTLIRQTFL